MSRRNGVGALGVMASADGGATAPASSCTAGCAGICAEPMLGAFGAAHAPMMNAHAIAIAVGLISRASLPLVTEGSVAAFDSEIALALADDAAGLEVHSDACARCHTRRCT